MVADRLPAVPDDDLIVEGEIVDDEPPAPQRATGTALAIVTDRRAQFAARHAVYVGLGVGVFFRRLWESRSATRFDRWLRGAEAAGDREGLLAIEDRRARFVKDRHQRRMDWLEIPGKIARETFFILGAAVALLLVIGFALAYARHNWAMMLDPFVTVATIVAWLITAVSASWFPFLLTVVAVSLALLWTLGRRHARGLTSGWLAPDQEEVGVVVTADGIVVALQYLPVAEMRRAFKDGWVPTFHQTPVLDGQGYSSVFSLPYGVTPQMVADQRPVLARNLHRAEVEVWPSDAEKGGVGPAGFVSMWVANRGVLSKPAPEYPLLHEGTADVFEGVPAGASPRGDAITLPVIYKNFVAGGQMGMGKSNACRVVMLGAALDPLAELWIHVLAYNGDFDSYQPRLARYVKGAEDEEIEAAVASLDELYTEVARREKRLAELGAKKVTRGLAMQNADLRPRLALFSECHEMFGHQKLGQEATDLAANVLRRARKTAIWLGFDTQSSRKDAIPPKVVELVSVNACFYVKSWRSNDGFLGDGSFAAGIRATELRPGRDIGTSLITGVSDAQFELLKWHYVQVDDDTGYDAAAEVIERAVAKARPGVMSGPAMAPAEARDLMADLIEVAGHERVRLADMPARLRSLAPGCREYRTLTGAALRDLLEDRGVRVTNTGNVPRLDPADLHRALPEPGE